MFKSTQIVTKTQLLKHFDSIARHLEAYPQPLLITQRKGSYLVLVNAEIWESFCEERFTRDLERGAPTPPEANEHPSNLKI